MNTNNQLNTGELREKAYLLFASGMGIKQIAEELGVHEKSVFRWRRKYEWEARQPRIDLMRRTAEERIWELVNDQLDLIERRRDKMKPDDEQGSFLIKSEVESLQKLFSTIKTKQLDWTARMSMIREFITYLKYADFELYKKVEPHITGYHRYRQDDHFDVVPG